MTRLVPRLISSAALGVVLALVAAPASGAVIHFDDLRAGRPLTGQAGWQGSDFVKVTAGVGIDDTAAATVAPGGEAFAETRLTPADLANATSIRASWQIRLDADNGPSPAEQTLVFLVGRFEGKPAVRVNLKNSGQVSIHVAGKEHIVVDAQGKPFVLPRGRFVPIEVTVDLVAKTQTVSIDGVSQALPAGFADAARAGEAFGQFVIRNASNPSSGLPYSIDSLVIEPAQP